MNCCLFFLFVFQVVYVVAEVMASVKHGDLRHYRHLEDPEFWTSRRSYVGTIERYTCRHCRQTNKEIYPVIQCTLQHIGDKEIEVMKIGSILPYEVKLPRQVIIVIERERRTEEFSEEVRRRHKPRDNLQIFKKSKYPLRGTAKVSNINWVMKKPLEHKGSKCDVQVQWPETYICRIQRNKYCNK